MGYSESSVAIKGNPPSAVLQILGLQHTGDREEFAESPVAGAELLGGWYLVVSKRDKLGLMKDALLQRLSADGEAVACFVEEHVMYSEATCWRNGQRVWSVIHNAQDRSKHSSEHLETDGQLPPTFNDVRDRWWSEQQKAGGRKATVDYIFEIPVELAHALTGYRHDRDLGASGERPFEVLAARDRSPVTSNETQKTSWLSRLFRRS